MQNLCVIEQSWHESEQLYGAVSSSCHLPFNGAFHQPFAYVKDHVAHA